MHHCEIPAVEPSTALVRLERLKPSPSSPIAIERAKKLLDTLLRLDAPLPFVLPTELRGIQFQWHGERFEVNLELLPESRTVYVIFQDGKLQKEEEVCNEQELRTLVEWLLH